LICLPHGGGAASSYRAWLAPLAAHIDVRPVQLPGRENRRGERFAVDMDQLVGELTDAVTATDAEDIALFGHSLGATIATRLCASLEDRGRAVRGLFVSGHGGPGPPTKGSPNDLARRMSALAVESDEGLWDVLDQLGGLPDMVQQNKDLFAVFVPIMRADHLLARGVYLDRERVRAPITVLAGIDDPLLSGADLSTWSAMTSGGCEVFRFPGGHFFLAGQRDAVADVIRRRLAERVGADATDAGNWSRS
jgi:surfactin synthase thioesterase subunit